MGPGMLASLAGGGGEGLPSMQGGGSSATGGTAANKSTVTGSTISMGGSHSNQTVIWVVGLVVLGVVFLWNRKK